MKQFIILICCLWSLSLWAQSERKYVREGNAAYFEGKLEESQSAYEKALEEAPKSPEAHFNLGNAYLKQKQYESAVASYQSALALMKDDVQKAEALHNIGNAYLEEQKPKEAKE